MSFIIFIQSDWSVIAIKAMLVIAYDFRTKNIPKHS